MVLGAVLHPEWELVAEIIAVIEKTAMLHQQPPRIDARPPIEPADRRYSRQGLNSFHRLADMFAFLFLGMW